MSFESTVLNGFFGMASKSNQDIAMQTSEFQNSTVIVSPQPPHIHSIPGGCDACGFLSFDASEATRAKSAEHVFPQKEILEKLLRGGENESVSVSLMATRIIFQISASHKKALLNSLITS